MLPFVKIFWPLFDSSYRDTSSTTLLDCSAPTPNQTQHLTLLGQLLKSNFQVEYLPSIRVLNNYVSSLLQAAGLPAKELVPQEREDIRIKN